MEQALRLDPATEPARIRAFFVAPGWARRGIGGRLLDVCYVAAEAEGFTSFELMATLPGVPLYARYGFREVERVTDRLPSGVVLEFVRMRR
jgi:GNAT superfamily N-acetyltransferase